MIPILKSFQQGDVQFRKVRTKQEQRVSALVNLHWCSFEPWNCYLFSRHYIKWEMGVTPSLLLGTEFILTYRTESPWVIIFGTERTGRWVHAYPGQFLRTVKDGTMVSIHEAAQKSTKTLRASIMQYESSHDVMCGSVVEVECFIFQEVFFCLFVFFSLCNW